MADELENRQQVEGEWDQAKGRVKQAAGALTGNDRLESEGAWDRTKGAVKEGIGDVKEAVNDVVNGKRR